MFLFVALLAYAGVLITEGSFTAPPPPPHGDWGEVFDIESANDGEGFTQVGSSVLQWIYPGEQPIFSYSNTELTVDPIYKRLKWHYGTNQGYQYTNQSGTWLTYNDVDSTTEPCFYVNYTYQNYVDYLKYARLISHIDNGARQLNVYFGMVRDPSNCDGWSAELWTQKDKTGAIIQYAFNSPYIAPYNGSYVPTMTQYAWNFDPRLYPVNETASYWQLPKSCFLGNPVYLPLCNTTFPPAARWDVMLQPLDPLGNLAHVLNDAPI